MSHRRITVRIDDELQRKLDHLARASGRTDSEIVREALQQHVETHAQPQNCLELAKKARLIGAAGRLPSDLSTNPRHFKGFGGG